MSLERVAVIFDDGPRPETTGVYCRRALAELVPVEHFRPGDLDRLKPNTFDLYIFIDDGLRYPIPTGLGRTAYWAIDTHMDLEWACQRGGRVDFLFAAQRDGAEQLRARGFAGAIWLPLACDPAIHRRHDVSKRRDVTFIGTLTHGPRLDLIRLLQQTFPETVVGQRYFDEMAQAYSESRLVFNRSLRNDVNMRVFEGVACGSLLLTNDLADNGQSELFQPDRHLVTYRTAEELLDKARFYLSHEEARERIAKSGAAEAHARHTYRQRMESILSAVGQNGRTVHSVSADPTISDPPTGEPSANWLDEIDFGIKTFLRPKALLRLLDSIGEHYPTAHVTIADDGHLRLSEDADSWECCRLIDTHPAWTLQALPFDAGIVDGRNALIDHTHRPYLLILDDDFCFTAETRIDRLYDRLTNDPRLGVAAGACIDIVDGQRQFRNSGGTLRIAGETLHIETQGWCDREPGLRDYVPQFALIRREVFHNVRWRGGLGAEHYDFCLQLQKHGWKVAHDLDVRIDHHPLTETLPGYRERRLDVERHQQWLLDEWGLNQIVQDGHVIVSKTSDPLLQALPLQSPAVPLAWKQNGWYYEFARPEVAELVPLSARKILDIGCGAGALGALLKSRQAVEVFGIELHPQSAQRARARIDRVLEQNIESPELDFADGSFDCVICADILEHIRQPERLLARIRRWLTPGGTLVASIPNVRHHSVVAALLQGNWTYEPAGLLDQDHVRFFTRREIEKILFRQGYGVQVLQSKPGPGDDERQSESGIVRIGPLQINGLSGAEANEYFTYQFLVVAQPRAKRTLLQTEAMNRLSAAHPWPSDKPTLAYSAGHPGWLSESARKLLRNTLNSDQRLVVELGAWLGLTTRFMADHAQNAKIITIDHWQGSPEHKQRSEWASLLPTLFETFLGLNWDYRHRIIPLRMTTMEGLRAIAKFGLQPDLIYIDAEHSYEAVRAELALCRQLFPEARLLGDDFEAPGVRRAVEEFAQEEEFRCEAVGAHWPAWQLISLGRPVSTQAPAAYPLTSIILVTCNELSYTRQCLDSLHFRTDEPFELIVVDNGSTDGTVDYLRALKGVTVIANGENRGFPAAANQGIRAARGENILLLNNDTVLTTGWLRRMLDVLDREPTVGLVGPCSNYCSGPQQVAVTYDRLDSLDGFAWDWGKSNDRQTIQTDRLVGFCLLFRRDVVDQIGLLDEQFGIGNFEDDDFCRRAIAAGFECRIARDAFIHHFGSRTFLGSGVDFAGILQENQKKYEAKWNNAPAPAVPTNGTTAPKPLPAPHSALRAPHSPPRFSIKTSPHGGLLLAPSTVRLSLCMIVRDNETTIGPCLESIRPYVDEIVVVDTGSKDRTPEICRKYGALLYEFPWCDDFSAARNESLKYARGEWLFWMDSDDTIPAECGEKLRALVDGSHQPNVMGYVMQVHCPGPGEGGHRDVTVVDHVKLIRNRPDLRFEGRIHEQLLPAIRRTEGDVAWTDLYVVHSGSDHSPETWKRKLERDLRILHRELADQPEHPFVLFNLGMTYADAKRYDEAIGYLEKCLVVSRPEESHLRKAYALLVSSLAQANRQGEAWDACQNGRTHYPDDKELLFREAMLHHQFGRLREAEQAYLQVLNGMEERHFSSIDKGLAGYKARHNLALVYEEMGRLNEAEKQWSRITREAPDYADGWRGLGEILIRQKNFTVLEEVLSQLLTRTGAVYREGVFLRGRLAATKGNTPSALSDFEQADQLNPSELEPLRYICRHHCEQNQLEAAERNLRKLTERAPNDAAAFHNLGTVQSKQHRPEEAIQCYRRSLVLRPDAIETWLQLGWSFHDAGRSEEALPAWREVVRRVPSHPGALAALREIESRVVDGHRKSGRQSTLEIG